jgi:large subunit ribosomal protein L13
MAQAQKTRFIGWQETPIHQATFGRTTKGGSKNETFGMKHSTGEVQEVSPQWYVIDASEAPIGRIASVVATILTGKHKPTFTPGAGSGDFVVLTNADKAFFTSNKDEKKIYYWHTGYVGHIKSETAGEALQRHPEKVLWDAVYGMMPKNKLSQKQLSHLLTYKGADHPHAAQKPQSISVKENSFKNLGA